MIYTWKEFKFKKETIDSKLAEIENAGKVTTLEAQIEALDEAIETKNQRISMVSEDENLSELVDKKKMKDMQREVKDLEKRKVKMEKLYEKMCGKKYVRQEMVDETMDEAESYRGTNACQKPDPDRSTDRREGRRKERSREHLALKPNVEDAGALREKTCEACEQERRGKSDAGIEDLHKCQEVHRLGLLLAKHQKEAR